MKRSLGLLVILLLLAGCATMMGEAPVTGVQARQMMTRTYDTTYDKLFQCVISALQDSGYTVTQADKGSGLILANHEQQSGVLANVLIGSVSGRMEVSSTVRKISDDQQELRLQFRSIRTRSANRYKNEQEVDNVNDPGFYQKAFAAITACTT